MKRILFYSFLLIPFVMGGQLLTLDVPADETATFHDWSADPTFEGVDRCKTCHRKPEDGEQYGKWQEGPHAKAYETLAGAKAKEYGAKRGIANPQTSDECLQCHVTGHGSPPELFGEKYAVTDGVGCESCHGPGGDYYKKSTMIAITKGEIEPSSVGLTLPDEKVCVTCHNDKSPSFDGFNFEEMKKKIEHPIPEAKMAEYK